MSKYYKEAGWTALVLPFSPDLRLWMRSLLIYVLFVKEASDRAFRGFLELFVYYFYFFDLFVWCHKFVETPPVVLHGLFEHAAVEPVVFNGVGVGVA